MAGMASSGSFSVNPSALRRRFRRSRPFAAMRAYDTGPIFLSPSIPSNSRAISLSASSPASPAPRVIPLPSPCRLVGVLPLSKRSGCLIVECSGHGDGGLGNAGGGGRTGGGGGDGGEKGPDGEGWSSEKNRLEALAVLLRAGRSLESIPRDLAAAIQDGKIPGSIVERFFELEKSPLLRWLLQFGGFKERLLADDLFLAKVMMECVMGTITKTIAEWERRRENFVKELDFVFADVAMAILADFMLVWLPAPTVSLRPALAFGSGPISKFFHGCPDNAFQVALAGSSYSLLQRVGAIVRNGAKLFIVGTGSSLVGTGIINALNNAKRTIDRDVAGETEDVPVVATSIGYGLYMAISSNLRYQILAGVVEQRILEPLLHNQKLALSALCFTFRTGNTYLGSLLWVDYARWIGVQQIRE